MPIDDPEFFKKLRACGFGYISAFKKDDLSFAKGSPSADKNFPVQPAELTALGGGFSNKFVDVQTSGTTVAKLKYAYVTGSFDEDGEDPMWVVLKCKKFNTISCVCFMGTEYLFVCYHDTNHNKKKNVNSSVSEMLAFVHDDFENEEI